MRILGMLKADASSEAGAPPSAELMGRMGAFIEEVMQAGVLLATDGLHPSSKGKRVKLTDGALTVIDGPFTESKELVASYALFQVKTMDEAVCLDEALPRGAGRRRVRAAPDFRSGGFRARRPSARAGGTRSGMAPGDGQAAGEAVAGVAGGVRAWLCAIMRLLSTHVPDAVRTLRRRYGHLRSLPVLHTEGPSGVDGRWSHRRRRRAVPR